MQPIETIPVTRPQDAESLRPEARPEAEAAAEPPLTVIGPTRGWRAIDLRELWQYRELLFFLTWRDVMVRYKQTVLGAAWAVIQPVMTMVVLHVFFGRLGGMSEHTESAYPIFVFAGLLPWQFFASSVSQSGQSLLVSSQILTRVYFPRLIMPFAAVGGLLVDFMISFCVMLTLMVYFQVTPTWNMLMLPVFVVGMLFSAVGVGTFLSALTVSYRDFRYVIPFIVQTGLFISPVSFPLSVVPERWRLVYALNPMAGVISGYRSALLGEPFQWGPVCVSMVMAMVTLAIGALYFRRMERRFADIV